MTDEEIAKLYLIEKYGLRKDIEIETIQHTPLRLVFYTYLEGLKAGKPNWHKVADGDYPPCEKGNCTISVLTDKGNIAYYSYNYDCWIAEPYSGEIDPPIAWCEIPTFEE